MLNIDFFTYLSKLYFLLSQIWLLKFSFCVIGYDVGPCMKLHFQQMTSPNFSVRYIIGFGIPKLVVIFFQACFFLSFENLCGGLNYYLECSFWYLNYEFKILDLTLWLDYLCTIGKHLHISMCECTDGNIHLSSYFSLGNY